ncbi:hypothetical protein VOLCADRAFT_36229, partial [Volvox carteri f. nagariensis]
VDRHNYYRALHGAPRLTWSPDLARDAAVYAVVAANNYHAGGASSMPATTGHTSAEAAVDSFYSKIELYNYNNTGFSTRTGHFTQVVWLGSTHIGIAEVNRVYVFRYWPSGNVYGAFLDNVRPR